MSERAFKYHGLGNDFVVLDRRASGEDISGDEAIRLCDRHRGVGADAVLVLLPGSGAAARMVVHNADGSVAQMCGNGFRCAVKYLVDHGPEKPEALTLETGAGPLRAQISYQAGEACEVAVSMGRARLVDGCLPSASAGRPWIEVPLPGLPGRTGTAVSMGNPHLVLFGAPLEEAARVGPVLERAEGIPERTNVEWVRPDGRGLEVVVWERGVGLTQACGTGACAAAAVGVLLGRLPAGQEIPVRLPGGLLSVTVAADLAEVRLRGPATFVFEAVVAAAKGR